MQVFNHGRCFARAASAAIRAEAAEGGAGVPMLVRKIEDVPGKRRTVQRRSVKRRPS